MKLEAQAERDRRLFEPEKSRMEHEFRMRNLGTQSKVVEMQTEDRIVKMVERQG